MFRLPFLLLRRQRGYAKMKCGNPDCSNIANVKYCSRRCSAIITNKLYVKRKRTSKVWKVCSFCGDIVRGKRHRACIISDGKSINKGKTIKEFSDGISIKGRHPSWKNVRVRMFCRTWNRDLTKLPCQVCGYSLHIELAHIKSVSSFDANTQLGIVNVPSNILVLCPNHHWEFDNGKLTLEQIPARKIPPKPEAARSVH